MDTHARITGAAVQRSALASSPQLLLNDLGIRRGTLPAKRGDIGTYFDRVSDVEAVVRHVFVVDLERMHGVVSWDGLVAEWIMEGAIREDDVFEGGGPFVAGGVHTVAVRFLVEFVFHFVLFRHVRTTRALGAKLAVIISPGSRILSCGLCGTSHTQMR